MGRPRDRRLGHPVLPAPVTPALTPTKGLNPARQAVSRLCTGTGAAQGSVLETKQDSRLCPRLPPTPRPARSRTSRREPWRPGPSPRPPSPKCQAASGGSGLLCTGLPRATSQEKALTRVLLHRRRGSKARSLQQADRLSPSAHLHSGPAATQVPNFSAPVSYLAKTTGSRVAGLVPWHSRSKSNGATWSCVHPPGRR